MPEYRDSIPQHEASAECILAKGLNGLRHAAAELAANAVAVLTAEGGTIETLYPHTVKLDCHHALTGELCGRIQAVRASTDLADLLKATVAPQADSFLIFPWRGERRVVIILFGFAGPEPTCAAIPDTLVESLNLAALAAWSFKEAHRLRAELRVVNDQLANRKLVERAKSLLQAQRGMTEQEAYEFLRKLSRQRRVTIAKVAEEFICAPKEISVPLRQ
jgi:hypothetical protein